MVVDGCGHFSPAGIVRVHTFICIIIVSQSAHDRAAGKAIPGIITQENTDTQRQRETLNVGTVQA